MLSTPQKGQAGYLKLPLIILYLSLLSGCAVNMMSSYDKKTDQRLETFTVSVNDLLYLLEEQNAKKPDCYYKNHVDAYRNLKVQLQTMDMHEQAKANNSKTKAQIKALQKRLALFITDHKRICQSSGSVQIAQGQINQMLGHILKLERAKRAK